MAFNTEQCRPISILFGFDYIREIPRIGDPQRRNRASFVEDEIRFEIGQFPGERRRARGGRRPDTFDFLGFLTAVDRTGRAAFDSCA